MSASNLQSINVDTLFERHSVPEIQIVHSKIRTVSENKREELRLMVGERYRDLLKAADTIADMQHSSTELLRQVETLNSVCPKLNDQQLLGFKESTKYALSDRNTTKNINNYFGTMLQIKLLTVLPELIWSNIDNKCFCAATELFILSRHISTGLQLSRNSNLMQYLNVANKQWDILKQFHIKIKQNLIVTLEHEELSAEVTVDCLLGLLLLEKISLNRVLKTFLQLRSITFVNCLNVECKSSGGNIRRVKDRILDSLKLVYNTMDLVAKCFMENGLLFQKLSEYNNSNSPPTIMLIGIKDSQLLRILPEIISNFKPKYESQSLDEKEMWVALEDWLSDTTNIVNTQLRNLFNFITTMSTIQEIKTEANIHKKYLNFKPIVKRFQIVHSFDFYETKYVPLINQRIRDIIHDSLANSVKIMFENLQCAISTIETNTSDIWVENNNDLPQSLETSLSDNLKMKRLLMKLKGYNSTVTSLCKEFDLHLEDIVSEMNILLEESETKLEDKIALIVFLRETTETQLKYFLKKLKSLNLNKSQYEKLLLIVRTCAAFIEVCPNLKICFCQCGNWRQWMEENHTAANIKYWKSFCQMLEEETLYFWQHAIDGILEENNFTKNVPGSNSYNNMLADFSNWEIVNLEQRDEQETTVQSTFRTPNQPRISLQSYLFVLIRILISIVPQTLPTKALQYYNKKVLEKLLHHYEELTNNNLTSSSQNIALQLYFDVKFLQNVFEVSRDEYKLSDQIIALQNKLKDLIDPFDFELLAEEILKNVKRSAVRLNCEFGVILSQQNVPIETVMSSSLVYEKTPNVLSLCTNGSTPTWFPLLPVVMTINANEKTVEGRKPAASENQKTDKTASTSGTTQKSVNGSNTSRAKSSTASFFGAMSQEWFR